MPPTCSRHAAPMDAQPHRLVTSTRLLLVITLPLIAAAAAPATRPLSPSTRPKPATVGEKVVAFCQQRKGQQVDNGECARLVLLALQAAGAKPRGKDNPNPGDYTWGTQVFLVDATESANPPRTEGNPADLRPGDIIQFRDAKFVRRVPGGRLTNTMPQHTAVLAFAESDGDTLHTLEQNVAGNRTVQECTYKLTGLRAGWLRFYRPLPATWK